MVGIVDKLICMQYTDNHYLIKCILKIYPHSVMFVYFNVKQLFYLRLLFMKKKSLHYEYIKKQPCVRIKIPIKYK